MNILRFAQIVGKLKRLRRTGWVVYKVEDPETVAEHSFRLAILTMVLALKLGVDQERAVKMALVHDIGEAEIGDIIVTDGLQILHDPIDKIKKERKAISNIFSLIDGKEYIRLFEEYEENKTPEARLVKQLDKLEMGIQALEYELEQNKNLESFFENVRAHITDEYLDKILHKIEKSRKSIS